MTSSLISCFLVHVEELNYEYGDTVGGEDGRTAGHAPRTPRCKPLLIPILNLLYLLWLDELEIVVSHCNFFALLRIDSFSISG